MGQGLIRPLSTMPNDAGAGTGKVLINRPIYSIDFPEASVEWDYNPSSEIVFHTALTAASVLSIPFIPFISSILIPYIQIPSILSILVPIIHPSTYHHIHPNTVHTIQLPISSFT